MGFVNQKKVQEALNSKQQLADYLYQKYGIEEVIPHNAQQSIKISDSMKQSVLYEGQPLFSKGAPQSPEPKLSAKSQAAYDAFIKWRESVVKMYTDRQIPINELEQYVPFIPMRSLKKGEADALRTVFGTGNKQATNVDELLAFLSKTDPNLIERTTKARAPSQVNKLLGKEWLTEDAAVAMSVRGTRAIKASKVADFLKGFIDKYGLNWQDMIAQNAGQIPSGYKMFITKTEKNGKKVLEEVFNAAGIAEKQMDGFFLPEDMAKLYNEYTDLIFGTQSKNPLLKVFDAATAAYKKVAYLWNPGHIGRDFAGNVWNGYLMGVVDPTEYIRAVKYITDPSTMIKLPSGEFTAQELLDKAHKMGVLDIGAYSAETPRGITDRLNLKGRNVLSRGVSKYSSLMREGTRRVDTLTRFTAFVHELQKGKSLTEAATQVKKFMFDYFDLTPFERRVMKRIIPFYTWTRKNIPLQLEMLAKNPRAFSRLESVYTAAQGGPVDWEDRPSFINQAGGMQLGEGGPYIAPNMPYSDLSRLPTSLDGLLQLLSGINPLISTIPQIATNTQWFSGKPLEQYAGETREIPLAGILKMLGVENTPRIGKRGLGTLVDQIPLLRNIDIMTNQERPDKQVSRLSSFIGGPSIYTEEGVERSKAYEQERALAELIRKLKDEGTEVPTMKDLKQGKFEYLRR
jgi:hypothetical protein